MRFLIAELRRMNGAAAPAPPAVEESEEWTPENCLLFEEGILTTPAMEELLLSV